MIYRHVVLSYTYVVFISTNKYLYQVLFWNRYDRAATAIRREIGLHQQSEHLPPIGRLAVALVLVQLARGDTVAAEKAFKEWGNCCEAPEVVIKTGYIKQPNKYIKITKLLLVIK